MMETGLVAYESDDDLQLLEKALEAFERAITVNPQHQQSRFNKGIVLRYDMNDRDGAVKAWEDLLRVNPAATLPNGMPLSEAIKDL